MVDPKLIPAIKTLWEFNQVNHKLQKADFILVLGSNDLNVPIAAAEIYKNGFANKIITSGGFGRLTQGLSKPEAEVFADIIINHGVLKDNIIIENRSTNTGENLIFSYTKAIENNLKTEKVILVTKPYMQKRALATFKKQWPNTKTQAIVTSPKKSFEQLLVDDNIIDAVNIMVGDTQRLKIYPKQGFMSETEIPKNVWQAYEYLMINGFDKELVKSQ